MPPRNGFPRIWCGADGSSAPSSCSGRASHDRRARDGRHRLRMLFALTIAALLVHLLVGGREAEEEAERRAHSGRAAAGLDRGRGDRRRAARGLRALRGLRGGPRGLHPDAGRDALSAADRHRRGDQPHHVGRLGRRPQVRAPARHRAAPARPARQAHFRHRARAVRAGRHRACDRPLGGRGRRSDRGDQGLLARHPDRRFHAFRSARCSARSRCS